MLFPCGAGAGGSLSLLLSSLQHWQGLHREHTSTLLRLFPGAHRFNCRNFSSSRCLPWKGFSQHQPGQSSSCHKALGAWLVLGVQALQTAAPSPCRVFIPKHAAGMRFQLSSCVTSQQRACTVRVLLGSITLPQSFQRSLTCTGSINCSLALDSPPWEKWLQIMVESLGTANASVSVEMLASFTGGIPSSVAVREGPEGDLCVLCLSWVLGCLAVVAHAPHQAGCLCLDALVFALGTKLKTPERLLLELHVWKHLKSSVLFF